MPCWSKSLVSRLACSGLGSTTIRKFASEGTTVRPILPKDVVKNRNPRAFSSSDLCRNSLIGQRSDAGGLRQRAGFERKLHLE